MLDKSVRSITRALNRSRKTGQSERSPLNVGNGISGNRGLPEQLLSLDQLECIDPL